MLDTIVFLLEVFSLVHNEFPAERNVGKLGHFVMSQRPLKMYKITVKSSVVVASHG